MERKKITIEIEMNNAAFDDGFGGADELQRTLNRLGARMPVTIQVGDTGNILDVDGNQIGQWAIKKMRGHRG